MKTNQMRVRYSCLTGICWTFLVIRVGIGGPGIRLVGGESVAGLHGSKYGLPFVQDRPICPIFRHQYCMKLFLYRYTVLEYPY